MMLKVFTLAAIVAVSSAGCYDDCGCPASIQALSTDFTYLTCVTACTTSCMGGLLPSAENYMKKTMDCSKEATQHGTECIDNIADEIGDVMSKEGMPDVSSMTPEAMQFLVDTIMQGMKEGMPEAAWKLLEGPFQKLATDKALLGKVLAFSKEMAFAEPAENEGVCSISCSGNQKMGENGSPGTCDCTGRCCDNDGDGDAMDLSDPKIVEYLTLVGVDVNALNAVMEQEIKNYVNAAKQALKVAGDALKAAGCSASRGRRMPAASVDACDVASWSACDGEDLSVMGVSDACFAAGSRVASDFPACNTCSPSIGGMAANVCVACKQSMLGAMSACPDPACKQVVLGAEFFGACSYPTVVTVDCEELAKAVATSEEALATSESALTDHIAAAASSAAATTASLAVAAAAGAVMFL